MQEMLNREKIENFIASFDGKFQLIDYGFPNNDYARYGFWLHLKANFPISINSFKVGVIDFNIVGRDIYVNRGFLNEIAIGLNMIS